MCSVSLLSNWLHLEGKKRKEKKADEKSVARLELVMQHFIKQQAATGLSSSSCDHNAVIL